MEASDTQGLHQRIKEASRDKPAKEEESGTGPDEQNGNGWEAWNAFKEELSNHAAKISNAPLNWGSSLDGDDGHENSERTWCSLHTPLGRRFQTAMITWHVSAMIFLPVIAIYALANPLLWFFSIPYFIYFLFDRAPGNGGVVYRLSLIHI